ncbi:BTB/POZ domain-containing protein 9-like [Drosophila persimilis]|uniref:BTB/POZ domain-containing protein 9-like n=1 Tax=Drosophila persimilis TaxID=7234 RepID=UPI000F0856A2|nr:BTB/POZ domain-containing protein 9-like [Drosophila persimilis]
MNHATSSSSVDIILGDLFLDDMDRFCMNELFSDVSFLVGDQSLPALSVILAARSEYFCTMLYGGMSVSNERQIRLESVPLEAFKVILRYLYSGKLHISTLDASCEVLGLANMYCLLEVESALVKHLLENMTVSNVWMILDMGHSHNLSQLANRCLKYIDNNGDQMLEHDTFQMLSKQSLEEVLRRDTFKVREVKIFKAVCKWNLHNPNEDIKSVMSLVRLSLMSADELIQVVRPSKIVEPEKIADAIEKALLPKNQNLPYRCTNYPDKDVKFLNSSTEGIFIDLSWWWLINCMCVLPAKPFDTWNCAMEVSCDMTHWDRAGTGTFQLAIHCEYITFTTRPVRYIRMVDTESGRTDLINYVMIQVKLKKN